MAGKIQKVIARIGAAAKIPALQTGEIGYDFDKKVFRVGDDTLDPPKIATNKSIGVIEYLKELVVKFGRIDIHEGGKVDGVQLATMRKEKGVAIHLGEGTFRSAKLVGDEKYITVQNLVTKDENGQDVMPTTGDVVITLSDDFKESFNGGTVKFTWGPQFPSDETAQPGHIHFLETEGLMYIRGRDTDKNAFWVDISSGGGSGGGGVRFWIRPTKPEEARVGDEWYDNEEGILYKLFSNNDDKIFWVQQQ